MFSSENLLLHDYINTLELKSYAVRWYLKDAILTDRAFYLYKKGSNYVTDSHQRITISQWKASLANIEKITYKAELPPLQNDGILIELFNPEKQKKQIVVCDTNEKASDFVRIFNLVAQFTEFEDAIKAQDKMNDQFEEFNGYASRFSDRVNASKHDQKFIEKWIQNYVLKDKDGETVFLNSHKVSNFLPLVRLLKQFFASSVISISFNGNYQENHAGFMDHLDDYILQSQLLPQISHFKDLQRLVISGNQIRTVSLETLGYLFQKCPKIEELDISNNFIGAEIPQGESEKQIVDKFLYKFFTELDEPKKLNLSNNQLTDECLYPVVKYIFANYECKMTFFSLENNRFTAYAGRTLLKAHSISPSRGTLDFEYGSLPLSINNLKAALITAQDQVSLDVLNISQSTSRIQNQENSNNQKIELTISRKSNNFYGGALKAAPVSRQARQKLNEYFNQIDSMIENREEIEIEEIQEFVAEITSEQQFEIPRYRLEPIFNMITDKIDIAIDYENIYILEILLDCLKYLNARYEKAEKKYYELANEAQQISLNLAKVLNMEYKDFNDMQMTLVTNLKRGKQIGLRGELIDAARNLYFRSDNELKELRNKASGLSDDEDEALYEVNDDERPLNVYDPLLDKYIDLKHDDLGLTSDYEINLSSHPYSTDYVRLTNLNLNYVMKNQSMARKNLLDEEAYGFRNIFERCTVLLNEIKVESENSLSYHLARNDMNLKMARLIFRYKNNMDKLFDFKSEPIVPSLSYKNMHQTCTEFSKLRYGLPPLRELQMVNWPITAAQLPLKESITKSCQHSQEEALRFNAAIIGIINQDLKIASKRTSIIQEIQDLFENYVIRMSTPHKKYKKEKKIRNKELADEFYLQLYHQISGYQLNSHQHQFFNAFLLMALLSNYFVPSTMAIHSGLFNEIISIKEAINSDNDSLVRLILRILNNFSLKNQDASDEFKDFNRSMEDQKFETNLTGVYSWPPFEQEVDSLINNEPIVVSVYLTNGEEVSVQVDEASTVEEVFEQVMENSSLKDEPEYEMFSLFRSEIKPGTSSSMINRDLDYEFDYPLLRDRKIMKLIFKNYHAQAKSKVADSVIEPIYLVVKRRIFHSLFVYNNFKALSKTSLEHAYGQQVNDYVNRNLLQSFCSAEDIVYLGSLIIRVKCKSKIPNAKKIQEFVEDNIKDVIPDAFIDKGKNNNPYISMTREHRQSVFGIDAHHHHHSHQQTSTKARNIKHWQDLIIEQYMKKSEFLQLSVVEAKEKFLAHVGLYNIMFSQVYLVEKDQTQTGKRETQRTDFLKQFAAQRNISSPVKEESDDSSSSSEDESSNLDASQDQIKSKKVISRISQIQEAPKGLNLNKSLNNSSLNEPSEDMTSKNDSSRSHDHSQIVEDSKESKNQEKERRNLDLIQKTLWQQFSGDHVLLIINMQGVQMLECSKRDRIVYHIDFEDILYVMGKGSKLKLGFVFHQKLADQSSTIDCHTVLNCCEHIGLKARCIAEDIISYAQIRLTELTKNHQTEYALKIRSGKDSQIIFKKRNYESVPKDNQKGNQTIDRSSLRDDYDEGSENEEKVDERNQQNQGHIEGLGDMELKHEDLLESFDLEGDEDEKNFISGLNAERQQTFKAATASERYQRQVQSRLGSAIKFRIKPFFAFNRKCPYHSNSGLNDQTKESSHHHSSHSHSENIQENFEPQLSSQYAQKQKFYSGGSNKDYMKKQHTVIEEDEEESSLANNTENNTPKRKSQNRDDQSNLNDFMAQMAQMDSQREQSSSNHASRNPPVAAVNTNSKSVKVMQSTSSAQQEDRSSEERKVDRADTQTEQSVKSTPSVDFTSIGKKEDREKEVKNLLGAALNMAPPI